MLKPALPQKPLPPALERLKATCDVCWRALVEPVASTPPQHVSRSRLLSFLLLIFPLPYALLLLLPLFGETYREFGLLSIPLLALAYVLNRRGRYLIAATISTGFLAVSPYALLLSWGVHSPEQVTMALIWSVISIIGGYLLFPLAGAAITAGLSVLPVLLLPIVHPSITPDSIAYVLFFIMATAALIVLSAFVRSLERARLSAQSSALVESDERYRVLFETSSEGIVLMDKGVVVDANPAFEAISGYALDELRGMDRLLLYAPEERDHYREPLGDVLPKQPYEARGIRKDGTRYWAQVQIKRVTYRGQSMIAALVTDITERRTAEEQLLALAVEREKVNVLQRFIGDVSHDLRTPLSVIRTNAYLLPRIDDIDKRQKVADAIEHETTRLQQMIEDLLDLSRLDKADTARYRFIIGSCNAAVSEAVEEMRTLALQKRHSLHADLAEDLRPIGYDRDEFKRMLKHLLHNAIAYTPEGGAITVTTRNSDGQVEIMVSDTGMGIAPADQPLVFERFYRADQARSASTGGVGVGLTIARKIAQAHGGTVDLSSEVDKGTMVRIRIPTMAQRSPGSAPVKA